MNSTLSDWSQVEEEEYGQAAFHNKKLKQEAMQIVLK